MEFRPRLLLCVWAAVLWGCVLGLQRPPPRYSQQYMPETSFSCRNKIVGSYYADPETDCQVFHVCVSVAGSIQDYKFLCPNDTAFDQESQTCADWYDVDCEAATLYYASDNFDLYRIGSGLESVHYDQLRSDAEPQDHLQRSETSDPVRSANNLKYSASDYNSNNKNAGKDLLKGSSSSNFYNRDNKEDEYETERPFKDEESKKKTGVRKVSRKQQYNGNGANNYASSTSTAAPPPPPPAPANSNSYTGFYSGNNFNSQRSSTYASSSTARPVVQDHHGRNGQRYNAASSTHRPPTTYQDNFNYQSTTTGRSTYNYNQNYNQQANYNQNSNYNQQGSNYQNGNYNKQQSSAAAQSTTVRPTTYKNSYQSYNGNQFSQTTGQPSTNYQQQEYTNYQRNYNNVQRSNSYQSSTPASTAYENYSGNNQYRSTGRVQESSPTTAKYYPNYASSSFAPTTYSPPTKKYASESTQNPRNENGQQYYEKNGQSKSSTQYYDSTKAPKKATQYSNYEGASGGKYYSESSTGTYELSRSSPVGIGFSPASINHLAESPRSTTPVPRRPSSATTYNPNSYNTNSQRGSQQSVTTPRSSTYVSGSARPFTSTTRFPSTTARPKSGKKNDYDYAYYDNAGGLEYDGLELEHVTGNKESSKISRN